MGQTPYTNSPRLRALGAGVASLLIVLAIAAPSSQAFEAVKKGDRGAKVGLVQRVLGLEVDRTFGPATKRAVKRFQRRHGLAVDGVVGPATYAALKRIDQRRSSSSRRSGGPSVRSRGSLVRALQRRLGISADGVFGPQTKAAVKRFQRSRGLFPDGVVGPLTWRALGRANVSVVLKRGSLRKSRGGGGSAIAGVIAAANRIATHPYKWGGGHGRWKDSGYDCSGSVSYALHGGGLLKRALDSSGFMRYGAPGKGRHITIYANPGHVFMVINGRRFDTSGRSSTGSRWQPDMRSTSGYTIRHPAGY
jgi:hypothetical protein